MHDQAPVHAARRPAFLVVPSAWLGIAALLAGCATAPVADTSAACLRMLPAGCGTALGTQFRVSVADGHVTDVVPIDPQAPPGVARAAQCLRAHPQALQSLAARVQTGSFEFGFGTMFCGEIEDASPVP
jgi:hypothetical protein